jgi:hypothetical protein
MSELKLRPPNTRLRVGKLEITDSLITPNDDDF